MAHRTARNSESGRRRRLRWRLVERARPDDATLGALLRRVRRITRRMDEARLPIGAHHRDRGMRDVHRFSAQRAICGSAVRASFERWYFGHGMGGGESQTSAICALRCLSSHSMTYRRDGHAPEVRVEAPPSCALITALDVARPTSRCAWDGWRKRRHGALTSLGIELPFPGCSDALFGNRAAT